MPNGDVQGAAIYTSGSLTLTDSTVTNTTAYGDGEVQGGALCVAGTLTITDSTIEDTTATAGDNGVISGGAIDAAGAVSITDATIAANTASQSEEAVGGALQLSAAAGALSVTDSTFAGNTASGVTGGEGGAIEDEDSEAATIVGSTFSGNSATSTSGIGRGGAIAVVNSLIVESSTFASNSAGSSGAESGGAIADDDEMLEVGASTFADNGLTAPNSSSATGAAIAAQGTGLQIGGDVIYSDNPRGGECSSSSAIDDLGYDVVDDNSCDLSAPLGSTADWQGASAMPGLGWNGGPTETIVPPASAGLTTIDPTSTAIGQELCAIPDQRGVTRPYGGATDCTIGATEAVGAAPALWNTSALTMQATVASSATLTQAATVTHAGTPSLSYTGTLPPGVTFADDGDGTATISGTPDAGSAGTYAIVLTANNGATQPANVETLTITVAAAPSPTPAPTPPPATSPTPAPPATLAPAVATAKPSVSITGVVRGAVCFGAVPRAACKASVTGSTISACTVTRHTSMTVNGRLVTLTATARTAAGGTGTARLTYTLGTASLSYRPGPGALYATGHSRGYTLVIVSKTKPRLIRPVPAPRRPTQTGSSFRADGKAGRTQRWKLTITLALIKHKPAKWHIGIRVGNKLDVLTLTS